MGVEDKGWIGGEGGSAADAMWDSMWGGKTAGVPHGRVTEGPLADFPEGYDPIEAQKELRAQHEVAYREKTARVLGNDNNFESPHEPGGNRVIQQNTGAGAANEIQQTPESARSTSEGDTKKDKSPSTGSRGGDLMRKLKAKGGGDPAKAETGTKSVGPQGHSRAAGHNLQVKDPAPVPKELDPGRRVGNLSAYQQQSAWTGSGPQAALHNDYDKVGELALGLLDIAGVPSDELPETSLLLRTAMNVAAAEMQKVASSEYLSRNDIHPLKVVAELSDSLGEDWIEWEPETIRDTLVKDAGVDPSDDVMSKIMAVKIVMRAPERFYDDWQAMEKISVALNDTSPTMGTIEDVPVEWLSNAVSIVEKLAGAGDFGADVMKYVAARLFDQGYVIAPPKLAFANAELGDLVKNDNLRKKVVLAYAKALKDEDVPSGEDQVSVQVVRLLRNHAYVLDKLDESRSQMS